MKIEIATQDEPRVWMKLRKVLLTENKIWAARRLVEGFLRGMIDAAIPSRRRCDFPLAFYRGRFLELVLNFQIW